MTSRAKGLWDHRFFATVVLVLAGTGYLVVFAKSSDEESSLEGI